MDAIVLLSLTMVVATCASGSESTQARGFDDWSSMSQQPEILIVKEKGGGQSMQSSSKMKDLTPLLCLLAPLLLAAIMLPSKMTMMMNDMNTMMMPMPATMMPGTMMPGIPNQLMPFRVTAMLTNGMLNNNNIPVSLPLFKSFIESKTFSEDLGQQSESGSKNHKSGATDRLYVSKERTKDIKENGWYVASTELPIIPSEELKTFQKDKWNQKSIGEIKTDKWLKKNEGDKWRTTSEEIELAQFPETKGGNEVDNFLTIRDGTDGDKRYKNRARINGRKWFNRKGETEDSKWSSRVWPTEKTTLAEDILNLFDEIFNRIPY